MKDVIKKILKENNDDFGWVKEINPVSKEEISEHLTGLAQDYGYNQYDGKLTDVIYRLGLNKEKLKSLYGVLYGLAEETYQYGVDIGWGEGYSSGEQEGRVGYDNAYNDAYDDAKQSVYDGAYDEGYDEGYNEGLEEGYQKGYEEGSEETYYKAFEKGRTYQEKQNKGDIDFESLEY